MTQVSAAQLRILIRETIAGQGMPWGGVREAEEWVPGQKTRAGALGRLGDTADKNPCGCSSASKDEVKPALASRAANTPDCAERPA